MAAATEWLEQDYYKVLGVPETASDDEIRKRYRKLARTAHPDANPDDADAEARFKELSAAYDVIGDTDKRKEYDELRRMSTQSPFGVPGGGPGGFRMRVTDDDLGDLGGLGGLFGDLFGDAGAGSARRNRPRAGQDLSASLRLPFLDAVYGTSTTVELVSEEACGSCGGSGAAAGAAGRLTCPTCGGAGQQIIERGGYAIRQTCAVCNGAGDVIDDPCAPCNGLGRARRPRSVKVRIPAGVDDGRTIRLAGRGTPGHNGGPAGDLYLTVDVEPHPEFGRIGDNLTLTVPVTFAEAALGADVTVPTLDGSTVKVRVSPGTPSGRTLRVAGKGVPKGAKTGDLLLTVDVDVPTDLTERERDLVREFAEASADRRPRARWEAIR